VGALAQRRNNSQIAKLFDRGHSSIPQILAEAGGIKPTVPVLENMQQAAARFPNTGGTNQFRKKPVRG
jgi:hypothetical protein